MKEPAIDTHAHLWPDAYLERLGDLGADGTAIAQGMGASDSEEDLEKRFKMMAAAGVETQVLSATPQSPYYGTAAEALASAQMINDTYAHLIEKHPGKFLAYGAVPLPHVKEAIGEAKRCLEELKFEGIAVNTYIGSAYPFDDQFYPFWEALNEQGTIVYVHPTGNGACSPMVNDRDLEWVVGAPIEDMLCVFHLLKSDIPYRLKNLTFHIAHLGGGLGFQLQRLEDNYEDWDAFPASPTETLRDRFYFDAANFLDEALALSVKVFGADKILMGSDFPYFQNEKYVRAADYIRQADLTDEEKTKILQDNAKALYRHYQDEA